MEANRTNVTKFEAGKVTPGALIRYVFRLNRAEFRWIVLSMILLAIVSAVADDIRAMPMQMQTILAEGGSVSGGQRQRIMIAHRLSTVRTADRIYVLDGGRVAEEGTFDYLGELGLIDFGRSKVYTSQ